MFELPPSLEIRTLEGKGRALFATRKFPLGASILSCSPYEAVLHETEVQRRCECCFVEVERPLRCAKTKFAHYKDRDHQKKGWVQGFKEESAAMVAALPRVPTPSIRLAARCILRSLRPDAPTQDSFADLSTLEAHWERLPPARQREIAQMAVVTLSYLGGAVPACPALAAEGNLPPARAVAMLLARMACNCHTLADEELRPYGIGIYPTGALVNHADRPNALQTFVGKVMTFRAIRDIAPGEEVTISYIDLAATAHERRSDLLEHYHFDPATERGGAALAVPPRPAFRAGDAFLWAPEDVASLGCTVEDDFFESALSPAPLAARVVFHARPYADVFATEEGDAPLVTLCREATDCPPSAPAPPAAECAYLWGAVSAATAAVDAEDDFDVDFVEAEKEGGDEEEPGSSSASSRRPPAPRRREWRVSVHVFRSFGGDESGAAAAAPLSVPELLPAALRYARLLVQLQEADLILTHGDSGGALERARAALRTCAAPLAPSADPSLPWRLAPRHVTRTRATALLTKAAIDQQAWEDALRASRQLSVLYAPLYPPYHPALSLQLAQSAKLGAFLERDPRVATMEARAAWTFLQATHPSGGAVLSSLAQTMMELREGAQGSGATPGIEDGHGGGD